MTSVPNESSDGRLAELLSAYDEARAAGAHPHLTSIDLSELSQEESRLYSQVREVLENVRAAISPYPSPTDPPHDQLEVGRFVVESELGRGGFGVVFLARDSQLKRYVALKLAHWSHFCTADRLEQFEREAEAAARLQHPGIATVHETGHFAGGAYIATEYCSGGSLREWMHQHPGPAPPHLVASLVREIAWALHHAHERGVLHQDIKPSNILLVPQSGSKSVTKGFPFVTKLTDFGLAKFLDDSSAPANPGHRVGTPRYMSPEQTEGRWQDVGVPSDIYALGVILHELLVGSLETNLANAPGARSFADYQAALREVRPRTHRDLESICLCCLEESTTKRYRTAADLAEDLDRFLRGKLVQSREASPLEHAVYWVRRKPAMAGAMALLVAFAISQLIWMKKSNDDLQDLNAELAMQRDVIATREASNRLQLYDLAMRDAQEMLERGQFLEADRLLSAYHPNQSSEDDDIRSFDWHFLWNLVHSRTPQEWKCHDTDVYDVDVSPDGRLLATSSRDNTVILWNLPEGTKKLTLEGHLGDVNSARFSPDGKIIASASDDKIVRIWDVSDGKLLHTLVGHEKQVNSLTFSPSNGLLYSSGQDGVVRLWNPRTGEHIASTPARSSRIMAMTSLPADLGVVTVDQNANIVAWSANLDQVLWMLEGQNRPPMPIFAILAPEGHPIYLGGASGYVESRDPSTGNLLAHQHLDSAKIYAIALSKDQSALLLVDLNGSIFVVDRSLTKEPSLLWRGRTRNWSVDVAPNSNQAFVSTSDGSLMVFDSDQSIKHPIGTLLNAVDIRALRVSNAPDSPIYCLTGNELRVLDPESAITRVTRRVPERCRSFEVDNAGERIAIAPMDDQLTILDAKTLKTLWEIPRPLDSHPHQGDLISFSPDSEKIALGSPRSPSVEIWDLGSMKMLTSLAITRESVKQIAWLGPDAFLCVGDALEAFQIQGDAVVRKTSFDPPAPIVQCVVDPSGPIVALDRNGLLLTLSRDDLTLISSARTWLDRAQAMSDVVEDHVVIADMAGNIAYWNIPLARAEGGAFLNGARLSSCLLHPASHYALVVVNDSAVNKVLLHPRPREYFLAGSAPDDVQISADGRWSVTTMSRGTTIIYDLESHRPGNPHEFAGTASAFSPDGTHWALADNQSVRWFEVGSWREIGRWNLPAGQFVEGMEYLAKDQLVLAMQPGGIFLLSRSSDKPHPLPDNSFNNFNGLAVTRQGDKVALVADDRDLRIWNLREPGSKPRSLQPSEDVMSIAWSHDGKLLAVGGRYGTISIYDHLKAGWQKGLKIEIISDISDITFSPDDQTIIVLNRSNSIHFGDLRARLFTYGLDIGRRMNKFAMSPDGRRLVLSDDHIRAGLLRWFDLPPSGD